MGNEPNLYHSCAKRASSWTNPDQNPFRLHSTLQLQAVVQLSIVSSITQVARLFVSFGIDPMDGQNSMREPGSTRSVTHLVPDGVKVARLDAALARQLPQLELAERVALLHDEVTDDQVARLHQRHHEHLRVPPRGLCTTRKRQHTLFELESLCPQQ